MGGSGFWLTEPIGNQSSCALLLCNLWSVLVLGHLNRQGECTQTLVVKSLPPIAHLSPFL